jgi:hypothetical protein
MKIFLMMVMLLGMSCSTANEPMWVDEDGHETKLPNQPIAIMIFVPDCPWAMRYASDFQKLQRENEDKKLLFAAVISGNEYSDKEVKKFRHETGYQGPIFCDKNEKTTQFLKATISPEFFLLDEHQHIQYRGAFDNRLKDLGQHRLKADSFYFRNAIEAMLRNDQIYPHTTQAVGCYLETALE